VSAAPLPTDRPELARWSRIALIVGAIGVAVCLVGALIDRAHFFRSWLVAFNLVLGLSLGSMVVIMVNYLTGGNWGFVTRRFLEAATRTLPLVTLLFVPLALGVLDATGGPYSAWTNPDLVDKASEHFDKVIAKKRPYLNWEFFLVRAVIYFAIWNLLVFLFNAWSKKQDAARSPALNDRCAGLSGPGIILYALTITFASIDWVMSLEPHWYSTIFMAIFGMGQILSGFVFGVAALMVVSLREQPPGPHAPPVVGIAPTVPNQEAIHPAPGITTSPPPVALPRPLAPPTLPTQTLSDLGTLMMAFIMVWAYLSFCQFLLIYSGNLPVEVTWYTKRFEGAWGWVATALLVLHFFLPFILLLNPSIKRDRRRVAAIAAWVLIMRVVETVWVIVPAFSGHGHGGSTEEHGASFFGVLLYPAALIGVGGLWLAFYLYQVRQLPLTPQYNPAEEAAHGQGAH
jgi:hypothetical protein